MKIVEREAMLLKMFERVIKWTKTPTKEAKRWWKRLIKSGYIKGNKLQLPSDFFDKKLGDIPFYLMVGCAKGYIEAKKVSSVVGRG